MSIYSGPLNPDFAAEQFVRIRKAFPQLSKGFFEILLERARNKGFSDKQLEDATNNLIDNFRYPVPTPASILDFDKRIKLYTYHEMLRMNDESGRAFKDHTSIRRNGKTFWVSNADVEMYKLKLS